MDDVKIRLKDVFAEVIKLASERRVNKEQGLEKEDYREKTLVLDEYLNSLDFEDVKLIQKVMYLGRGGAYDESKLSSEIFQKIKTEIESEHWNSQRIEASQISQKVPLDKYLIQGLNKLDIQL